jgi:Flp pilus assembly protein TadD
MENPARISLPKVQLTVLILLVSLIVPIYAHVGGSAWQLDDRPNIVDNRWLHLDDLMPSSLWGTFFANQGKGERLFRPVANLSFALNWYLGQDDPTGYRWCNILLHILTAFTLYNVISMLGQTPKLQHHLSPDGWHFAALLTATLWAVNPIQIQAVTYVVQRMTILATLFYLLGMHAYLKARMADELNRRFVWVATGVLYFLLAVGSKENAILLPASLVLLELIGFQGPDQIRQRLPKMLTIVLAVFLLIGLGALFFMQFDPVAYFEKVYSERPFTLSERLLTQSRVVLFYISLLLIPSPNRLSIVHDVVLSNSLWYPWTTLPAILLLTLLGGVGVWFIWRRRLIALAILFFLLNHLIESSILPLELVFEHRNYLPSLFIFLPVAVGIWRLLESLKNTNHVLFGLVAFLPIMWIVSMGVGTYIRNMDWMTEESLWTDAMIKAPHNARPLNNLAIRLAWSERPSAAQYAQAYAMFRKSLDLDISRDVLKAEIIGNMATILYHNGTLDGAVKLYQQALVVDPEFLKGRYDLIMPLILMGRLDDAKKQSDILVAAKPFNPAYLNLRGFILIWQGDPVKAMTDFRRALALAPHHSSIWLNIGVALNRMDSYSNAEWFLRQATKRSHGDMHPRLALIENAARAGDQQRAQNECRRLAADFPLPAILAYLERLPDERRFAPIANDIVAPIIHRAIAEIASDR